MIFLVIFCVTMIVCYPIDPKANNNNKLNGANLIIPHSILCWEYKRFAPRETKVMYKLCVLTLD